MEGDVLLGEKIKVNRKFYKKWDLDEISKLKHYQFDKWWKNHRQLFQSEPYFTMKDIDGEDSLYIKIPVHRYESDVVAEFRELIKEKLKGDAVKYPLLKTTQLHF